MMLLLGTAWILFVISCCASIGLTGKGGKHDKGT